MRIVTPKTLENDFIDHCVMMALNFHWSMDEILDMPASRWFLLQERTYKIKMQLYE